MNFWREEIFVHRFSTADFLAACHQAFERYGAGVIDNPPRTESVQKRGSLDYFRLDMPAEWPGKFRARKIIEEFSDVATGRLAKREAYIAFEDLQQGRSYRLEAGHITDWRTGAAGALGLQYLAGAAIERVAILGTGRIARTLALSCDALFDLAEIACTSRREANRAAFAKVVEPDLHASLRIATSLETCIAGADAVLTAVPTPQPILTSAALAEVPYLAVLAGDSRTRQLAPEVLYERTVVVDVLAQAQKSGEFRFAAEQGQVEQIALARNAEGTVLDIGDAACGRLGTITPSAVYLTGMGAQDLCAAAMVYRRLLT
ncbi:MAG: hypothetical protein OXH63_18360 [Gemmatimonadetes bacterium]|nr:hypothetical protein [Gemmatimonadota bacterium]